MVVGSGRQNERYRDADAVKARNHPLHAGDVPDGLDLGHQRRNRLDAERVGLRLVGARAVEVADQLIDGSLGVSRRGRGLVEDLVEAIFRGFARGPAPAPSGIAAGIGFSARHRPLANS